MEALIFICGIVLGSFYNVVIHRLPVGESLVKPPVACGQCNRRLSLVDLIPLLRYIVQNGKCKNCGAKISIRHPLIELLTGVLFVWIYVHFGFSIELAKGLFLVSMFLIISFIDLDHQIIPDKLNLLLGIVGGIYLLIVRPFPLSSGLYGLLVGGGCLFIIALIGPMGGGDIKFMAAVGLWFGFGYTLMTLVISFTIGGMLSGGLLLMKAVDRKTAIPFGPFLCIASLVVMLYGQELIIWYVRTFL